MAPDNILNTLVGFVAFIFSIVVHENAHGLVADHFGDPTARYSGRLTLNPIPHIDLVGSVILPLVAFFGGGFLIGWAKPVPVNPANLRNPLVHNAYVAMAGPASNLVLAAAAALVWILVRVFFKHLDGAFLGGENTLLFFTVLCDSLIKFNCILMVFNLLPIPPLDGHWILMRFLPPGPRTAFAAIGPYGFFILIVLVITGVLGWIISFPLQFMYYHIRLFIEVMVNFL
jgi:Zn-dependent protease